MLRALIISSALLASAPLAFASKDNVESAEALVSTAATDISQSEREQVADAVLSHVDTKAIANFTLGRYGTGLKSTEKARYVRTFEDFLRRQIQANADQFSGVEVEVVDTAARNARDAIVTTQVRNGGDTLKVRWRVIERSGKWSVVDLEVAGIWLAIEQRAQVAAILSRPGANIDDLIAQFG
ncbi:MAG: ABC transporter substrate-binding protein [Hyphomonadaceae bacterium]|nr:ABC transporter substrate-binding protein [Hyphomonadaceae bacterium]